jgi:hypothetical protein
MTADELVKIHLELECVRVDTDYFMRSIECPDPDTLFRFYMTRYDGGYTRYYRHNLAPRIYEQLRDLPAEEAFSRVEVVKNALALDQYHRQLCGKVVRMTNANTA